MVLARACDAGNNQGHVRALSCDNIGVGRSCCWRYEEISTNSGNSQYIATLKGPRAAFGLTCSVWTLILGVSNNLACKPYASRKSWKSGDPNDVAYSGRILWSHIVVPHRAHHRNL